MDWPERAYAVGSALWPLTVVNGNWLGNRAVERNPAALRNSRPAAAAVPTVCK